MGFTFLYNIRMKSPTVLKSTQAWFSNIRVVLVDTSHPGNIGAVARAMKTMGLSRLYLCQPHLFPHEMASTMASGADDVLDQAIVCGNLDEALSDCTFVVGASARLRRLQWPQLNPRECAFQIRQEAQQHEVAIIFGRESSGLTNDELDKCHYLVNIPANPEYSSLNLAAAVQILCYELRMCLESGASEITTSDDEQPAQHEVFESYMQHLYQVMLSVGFLKTSHLESLQRRVRRVFGRARLTATEINILRGFLSAIEISQRRKSKNHR